MIIEHFIERFVAIYLGIVGFAFFCNPSTLLSWMHESRKTYSTYLFSGILSIIFGAFIVGFHNTWDMGPSVITTIIGYMALMKGFILLVAPSGLFDLGQVFYDTSRRIRLISLALLFLSIFIYLSSF